MADLIDRTSPAMTIDEIQYLADSLNVKAFVINSANIQRGDVETLFNLMRDGTTIVVFIRMHPNAKDTQDDPSGHFIALVPVSRGKVEIFDPAGSPEGSYLNVPWIRALVGKFDVVEWFEHRTQRNGSNSCGPWTLVRAKYKNMDREKFALNVNCKIKKSTSKMKDIVNRNDTLEAFGPIGREAPHMSSLKAKEYAKVLMKYTNLNEPAAKQVAHVINRAVKTNPKMANMRLACFMDRIMERLPKLRVHESFIKDYGCEKTGDFNDFVMKRNTRRKPKSITEHALKKRKPAMRRPVKEEPQKPKYTRREKPKYVPRKKRGGAMLGGAMLGGALLGGAYDGEDEDEGMMGGYSDYWRDYYGDDDDRLVERTTMLDLMR